MNNIISLSGGKDSTAMLLMMIERNEPIHSAVWFDTGWEFPEMLEHIDLLEKNTGVKIVRLSSIHNFDNLLKKYSWPWMRGRWCTREKIRALDQYSKKHNGIKLIGLASDEIKRTKSKEMSKKTMAFPLIEWGVTEKEALAYCLDKGYSWGGLYNHFSRVSCFCCPLKKIGDYRKIRKHYPGRWNKMLEMDKSIQNNRGFKGYKTVHDLDGRFAEEDRQMKFERRGQI